MSGGNFIERLRAALEREITAGKDNFSAGKYRPETIERESGKMLGLQKALDLITLEIKRTENQ